MYRLDCEIPSIGHLQTQAPSLVQCSMYLSLRYAGRKAARARAHWVDLERKMRQAAVKFK